MSIEFTGSPDAVNDRLSALESRVLALEMADGRTTQPADEVAVVSTTTTGSSGKGGGVEPQMDG